VFACAVVGDVTCAVDSAGDDADAVKVSGVPPSCKGRDSACSVPVFPPSCKGMPVWQVHCFVGWEVGRLQ
jgi:hypothetical protein